MEKIKDFIHDSTDILLAIIIACAMFFVVIWNLGNWFHANDLVVLAGNNINVQEQTSKIKSDIADNNEKDYENDEIAGDLDEDSTNQDNVTIDVIEFVVKTIDIPLGAPASKIASILWEAGLIESTQEFIKICEKLNLTSKLKPGTFEISTESSMEDIAKIIAGIRM